MEDGEKGFGAIFKGLGGDEFGILANKSVDGKRIIFSDIAAYGKSADGKAMTSGSLKNKLREYMNALDSWAKEQGFEEIVYQGRRSANSSSAKPGKTVDVIRKLE